ncbi:ketodeoxygluconokinase [Klebsiella pneumoniae]|nr:ketodeoxygluconokinase [Klebsiella pneumoniae]
MSKKIAVIGECMIELSEKNGPLTAALAAIP